MIYLPNSDYYGSKAIQESELLQHLTRYYTDTFKHDYNTRLDIALETIKLMGILWKQ